MFDSLGSEARLWESSSSFHINKVKGVCVSVTTFKSKFCDLFYLESQPEVVVVPEGLSSDTQQSSRVAASNG